MMILPVETPQAPLAAAPDTTKTRSKEKQKPLGLEAQKKARDDAMYLNQVKIFKTSN